MSRSKWKGPFLDISISKASLIKKPKIWCRSSVIPSFLVGESVFIHNGKEFKRVSITRDKVGYKFGEFSFTRRNVSKAKLNSPNVNKKKV
jgi:small subunit ribosomal protein S19